MALLAQVSTQRLFVSSIGGTSLTISTPTSLLSDTVFRTRVLTSTLGNDDMFITLNDIGLKFVITTSNFLQNVTLPDPSFVGSGYNITICNSRNSGGNLDIYTFTSNYIFSISPATASSLTSDGNDFYPF